MGNTAWVWLVGSLVVAVVWSNLAWASRKPWPGQIGAVIEQLKAWPYAAWLLQFLRLLYYVGLPFAALVWGRDAVTARLLGLQVLRLPSSAADAEAIVSANWLDWLHDIGWAAALGLGLWGLLALSWWTFRRAVARAALSSTPPTIAASGWTLLGEAVFHEVHWAFYRNAPILMLDSAYWGTWVALALVAVEALANPAWHRCLGDRTASPICVTRLALAPVSGLLYLQTGNLWLAIALHLGVSLGLTVFLRALPLPVRPNSSRPGSAMDPGPHPLQ